LRLPRDQPDLEEAREAASRMAKDARSLQLKQVLMNLLLNGMDAIKGCDTTRQRITNSQPAKNEQIMVSVSDTGAGLPQQQADQVFNAFFTTRPQGPGVGLCISRSIVESWWPPVGCRQLSARSKLSPYLPTKAGA
jgi:C4-dicarboxylate-specific signal transduction histidine kinase